MFKHEKQEYNQPETQKKDTVVKESHKPEPGKCKFHPIKPQRHCIDCDA